MKSVCTAFRFLLTKRHRKKRHRAARTTRPAVTPPAIAPAFEWLLLEVAGVVPTEEELVAEEELIDVGCVEEGPVAIGADSEELGRPLALTTRDVY